MENEQATAPERQVSAGDRLTRRSMAIDIAKRETDASDDHIRRLTFPAASSVPLARSMIYGVVRETLDMKGLDDARLNTRTMPLLDSHRNDGTDNIKATIVGHEVVRRENKGDMVDVLMVTAEFNLRDDLSRRMYERIENGLVRNVSVGYCETRPGSVDYKWNDLRADYDPKREWAGEITWKHFAITEVSMCGAAADNDVGLGRSVNDVVSRHFAERIELDRARARAIMKSDSASGDNTMTDEQNQAATDEQEITEAQAAEHLAETAAERAAEKVAARAAKKAEKADRTEVIEFDHSGLRYLSSPQTQATLREQGVADEFLAKLVGEAGDGKGMSADQAKLRTFEHLQGRDDAVSGVGRGEAPAIAVDGAHRRFDISRLARQLTFNEGRVDGREGEYVAEHLRRQEGRMPPGDLRTELPVPKHYRSIQVPFAALAEHATARGIMEGIAADAMRREAHFQTRVSGSPWAVGTGTPDGMFFEVFNENWFVEAYTADGETLQHITRLPMELYQDIVGVTESGQPTTEHLTTETAARNQATGLSFGNRKLQWKCIATHMKVSQRTIDQSHTFIGLILNRMRKAIIRGMNQAVINGNGSAGAPTGILNFSGLHVKSLGTNGATPDYATLLDVRTKVEAANAPSGMGRYLMTPEILSAFQRVGRLTGSQMDAGDRIIDSYKPGVNMTDGYPITIENLLPKTLSKGTGTNLHAMVFGVLSEIELGLFSGFELLVDPYASANTGQINYYMRQAYDFSPRHVESFSVVKDAIAPTL